MAAKASAEKRTNGDALLYRLFLRLAEQTPYEDLTMPLMVIKSMAIWFPRQIHSDLPVLLPFVVRDPTCRGNAKSGIPDAWSSPNSEGFLRDDNSLVKGLVKSLAVRAPSEKSLHGARLGTGFVAAHIWRETTDGGLLASRRALLNTFVPNIVWLPRQIAKLTDIEGGPYQRALQMMSWSIYRDVAVASPLSDYAEMAWSLLGEPSYRANVADDSGLNWFQTPGAFVSMRRRRVVEVVQALELLADGKSLNSKVVTTRYTAGLPKVDPNAREALTTFLEPFIQ